MKNIDWDKEMPNVPQNVHNAVLYALENLEEEKRSRKRMFSKRKMVILVAALVAAFGTTAVAAEFFKWNEKAVEYFDVPAETLQDEMVSKGVAKEQNVSATDNGITVTAVQTIKDEHRVYILLDIQANENVIDANGGFGQFELFTKTPDMFVNIGGSFAEGTEEGKLSKQGYYEWDAMIDSEKMLDDDSIMLELNDFCYYTYENGSSGTPHTVEGNWNLEIPLGKETEGLTKIYEVNREVMMSGMPVTVNRVEISPITLQISYKATELDELREQVYGGNEDIHLEEIYVHGFLNKEGEEILCGYGGTIGERNEKGEELLTVGLGTIIDVESVSAVLLGEEKVVVELE